MGGASHTNGRCIYYFPPREGHTCAKHRHRNCFKILFKSIAFSRGQKLNTNFFSSCFSGAAGISQQQNPGTSRPKSLISLVSRDIPNLLGPTPSRGRPLPHRKISGLKSLGLCSFFVPDGSATMISSRGTFGFARRPENKERHRCLRNSFPLTEFDQLNLPLGTRTYNFTDWEPASQHCSQQSPQQSSFPRHSSSPRHLWGFWAFSVLWQVPGIPTIETVSRYFSKVSRSGSLQLS